MSHIFRVNLNIFSSLFPRREVKSIFDKEVQTMKRFESPNILRMFGICVQNEDGECKPHSTAELLQNDRNAR